MPTFRKRPVEIEAVRWTGENFPEVHATFGGGIVHDPDAHSLLVHTLEGRMRCSAGNWVIRGIAGELYPCDDAIFRSTYDEV